MIKILHSASLPAMEKIQDIQRRKKEEWKIEIEKEQYRLNTKNYFNLTKQSEEQAKFLAALSLKIQDLESKFEKFEKTDSKWKNIAIGIVLLATIEFMILLKFIS